MNRYKKARPTLVLLLQYILFRTAALWEYVRNIHDQRGTVAGKLHLLLRDRFALAFGLHFHQRGAVVPEGNRHGLARLLRLAIGAARSASDLEFAPFFIAGFDE